MERHIGMHQRRAEKNDIVQSNGRNTDSFPGSNSKEDMDVCVTKMDQNLDRYKGDDTMNESSDENHSSSHNSSHRLRTKDKNKQSPQIQIYDNHRTPIQQTFHPCNT